MAGAKGHTMTTPKDMLMDNLTEEELDEMAELSEAERKVLRFLQNQNRELIER